MVSGSNLLFYLLVSAMAAVVLMAAVNFGRDYLANLRQPLLEIRAEIIARRVQEDQGSGWSPAIHYLVTFATESGEQQEYTVSEDEYAVLFEGQTGILRNRGKWYQGFQKQQAA